MESINLMSLPLLRNGLIVTLVACALTLSLSGALAKPPKAKTSSNPHVIMKVASRGEMDIELYPKAAPKTVAHFLDLVNQKFYDGILFHRVISGFVAQAGDPKSKDVDGSAIANIPSEQTGLGSGGSGTTVPLEAKLAHDRGTLGLARAQDPDSGDSQFFLNLVPNHSLDSGYCVFGKVVRGLDVMDSIKQGDKITSVRVVAAKKK